MFNGVFAPFDHVGDGLAGEAGFDAEDDGHADRGGGEPVPTDGPIPDSAIERARPIAFCAARTSVCPAYEAASVHLAGFMASETFDAAAESASAPSSMSRFRDGKERASVPA